MFYFITTLLIFNVFLLVLLYKRPMPKRVSKWVAQMEKESLAPFHRRQRTFFDTHFNN